MSKRQEIAELKAERDRLINDIASLHIAVEVATRRNKGLQAELAATNARNTELEARNTELEAELAVFTTPAEPVLPPEPPVGTVLLQTDEQGVPLPGARAIKRTEEGWIGATDWPETWVEVVDWAPFVVIYSPAQSVPLTNADIETIVFPAAGEQA